MILAPLAFATSGFDASTPAETFTGQETYTRDGATQLWSAVERLEDPDRTLFAAGQYNGVTAWQDTDYSPWIATCFGTSEPHTSAALLHVGLYEAYSSGTPILFVPGAGDNGSRGFITMARHMELEGRPVYAVTFAHSHGDVLEQAEIVADAIARVKARTGAAQVDVVSHSKGGIATAVYLSNADGAEWGDDAYELVGTRYRGDVRKAVFVATPLSGIDTAFRWPLANLWSLDWDSALSPTSWGAYWPYGTSSWAYSVDLAAQDFLPDDGDLFPGHRQLLERHPEHDLPGEMPWLGAYSVQPDWYTTYEGGLGYWSMSGGIDEAIEAGGGLLARLQANGVDPAVQIYLLAGENPIMPNGTDQFLTEYFGEQWSEMAEQNADAWGELVADAISHGTAPDGVTDEEVAGLAGGDLVLGEVSGASDGLVFVTSATAGDRLGARGAVVVDTYVANLSHLDLLYASPITGELLIEAADADPEGSGWMRAFGERYTEADTIGWVDAALADPDDGGDDTGDPPGDDTGEPPGDDSGDPADTDEDGGQDFGDGGWGEGCKGCDAGGVGGAWLATLIAGAVARRRGR
ncbi:MAG: esterase/lipase family protein [Myxococcota bacterium]